MPRPRIAIVVAFFGRAPMWLPAFFLSCRANADVQWFIYTDVDPGMSVPANVNWKSMSVGELGSRASEALGGAIEIQFSSTRKINDLKPSYGLVFEDDLRPFDFWAYSDLDIVWGDVRHFVTDSLLADYDVVSSRRDRVSGHFTLHRNTSELNRIFQLIPNYPEAMANPEYLHLDERGLTRCLRGILHKGPQGTPPRVYWTENFTIDAEYQRAMGDGERDALWWRKGKTFGVDGKEFMYLHFHKIKQEMHTIDFGLDDGPDAFMISRKGFSATQ